MLQMKERAKFMPENKVFGQAGGAERKLRQLVFYSYNDMMEHIQVA